MRFLINLFKPRRIHSYEANYRRDMNVKYDDVCM